MITKINFVMTLSRREVVMERIAWKKDLTEAKKEMSEDSRLALLCFGNESETASNKTFSETLNDVKVTEVLGREFSPIRIDVSKESDLARKYLVNWAPEFIVTDGEGRELERWQGYLPAKEFVEQMLISKARAAFHLGRMEDATALFNEIVDEHPESEFALEAEYNLGIISLKTSGEYVKIAGVCETLNNDHPESIWAKRCAPWAHTGIRKEFVPY